MWGNRTYCVYFWVGLFWLSSAWAEGPSTSPQTSPMAPTAVTTELQASGTNPEVSGLGSMGGSADDFLKIRDPFRAPDFKVTGESKPALEQDPVESFRVVGVLTGLERLRAIVQNQAGSTFFVAQGTKIGMRDGFVLRITSDGLVVREKVMNILGQTGTVDLELKLHTADLSHLGQISHMQVPETQDLIPEKISKQGMNQKQTLQQIPTREDPAVIDRAELKASPSQELESSSQSSPAAAADHLEIPGKDLP